MTVAAILCDFYLSYTFSSIVDCAECLYEMQLSLFIADPETSTVYVLAY